MTFGFFKKKEDPTAGPPAEVKGETWQPSAANARKFFDSAQAMHDATQYEYATILWLQGLRMDPNSVAGLESFAKSASEFLNANPRTKAPTKDQLGTINGKHPMDKYVQALLYWGCKPMEWTLGLKAFEQAVKLGLNQPAEWIGKRVLGIAGEDPKASKNSFVQLMNLFYEIKMYDQAVNAGEIACRLDPKDGKLAGEVKNMAAQATMKKSGYEGGAVDSGFFRKNVKDLDAVRAMQSDERIVKTEEDQRSAIERAKADYDARPTDVGAIQKLATMLRERGLPEDEKLAYQVLIKAYQDTKNFRFKTMAGDLNLRVARRQVRAMQQDLAANPDNAEKQAAVARAERQLADMEVKEYEERVANNPTDASLRYELGRRFLDLKEDEKAIEQLQQARGSPAIQTGVMSSLGVAFGRLGWLDEAESSYREAINSHTVATDDLAADLRYGLLDVLQRKAEENRDLQAAEEAFKLASGIALQRINYKDIRARRQQLQDLVKSLRS